MRVYSKTAYPLIFYDRVTCILEVKKERGCFLLAFGKNLGALTGADPGIEVRGGAKNRQGV